MRLTTAFLPLMLVCLSANATPPERNLFGKWKISQVLDSQATTSLSSDDAEKLIGRELVIGPTRIEFAGAACNRPKLTATRHRMVSYFVKAYNFVPKKLPLPDTVTEIGIVCDGPVGIDFMYIRDRRQIVLFWEGFFLNAVKQAK